MRSQSTNRKILNAAVVVGFFTVFAKSGTALKELQVAKIFGRGDEIDAYLIAYLIPSFALTLLMASLGSALVPAFVETRAKAGMKEAQRLFSSAMLISIVVATVAALLLGLLAPFYLHFVASGFPPAKLRLTREVLYFLLPLILVSGVSACISSVLSAFEKFALPAAIPAITPVVVILSLRLYAVQWGAYSLAIGAVVGSAIEACLLVWLLRMEGIHFSPKWGGFDDSLRSVWGQYLPLVAGSFLLGSAGVIDQSMATMLPQGSVAALGYANRVVTVFTGIGGLALSAAVLPYFSRMAAEDDWEGCRHTLKHYLLLTLVSTLPISLVLIAFSESLIRVLFQRGAFTQVDTHTVSSVLICYSVQIPFYIAGLVTVRFISAIKRNDLLLYGAVISLFLDVSLNLVLMRYWGVAGIALSTSIVYIVSFLFLGTHSVRLIGRGKLSEQRLRFHEKRKAALANAPAGAMSEHD